MFVPLHSIVRATALSCDKNTLARSPFVLTHATELATAAAAVAMAHQPSEQYSSPLLLLLLPPLLVLLLYHEQAGARLWRAS